MIRLVLAALLALAATLPARAAVDIEEVTSPGGISAWLVEEPQIPFMALEIRFKGGASLDRDGKRGAVHLMTALLEEGAGEMSAQDFAARAEELAVSYEFDVYDDALSISARFLTENRDEAVALLRTAIHAPRFDADAIERVRGQVLSIIRSDLTDPTSMAQARFDAAAFGDHPYATPIEGTVESVEGLNRGDLVAAHGDVFSRDRLYVSAVGDITAEELGPLLDELLGDLPAAGAPAVPEAEWGLEGGVTVVPFETPQSVAYFGHPGIARDDPDFFPAYVVNEIFGGSGRQSRLMEEVREKRGLTYGIGAFLAPKDKFALILGQGASANDRVAEMVDVVEAEWDRIATEGITEEELTEAKTYLTGAYPLRFDGNAPIARILVGMQMDDLPTSYVATRNDEIEAVTLADANRVAARIYDPGGLRFVVVGQPDGLEPTN